MSLAAATRLGSKAGFFGLIILLYLIGTTNVAAISVDAATGALAAVPGSPFATPQNPGSGVVHPNGKFAYVSAAATGQIVAFNIGANGALTPAAGSPFAARNNLFWMAM